MFGNPSGGDDGVAFDAKNPRLGAHDGSEKDKIFTCGRQIVRQLMCSQLSMGESKAADVKKICTAVESWVISLNEPDNDAFDTLLSNILAVARATIGLADPAMMANMSDHISATQKPQEGEATFMSHYRTAVNEMDFWKDSLEKWSKAQDDIKTLLPNLENRMAQVAALDFKNLAGRNDFVDVMDILKDAIFMHTKLPEGLLDDFDMAARKCVEAAVKAVLGDAGDLSSSMLKSALAMLELASATFNFQAGQLGTQLITRIASVDSKGRRQSVLTTLENFAKAVEQQGDEWPVTSPELQEVGKAVALARGLLFNEPDEIVAVMLFASKVSDRLALQPGLVLPSLSSVIGNVLNLGLSGDSVAKIKDKINVLEALWEVTSASVAVKALGSTSEDRAKHASCMATVQVMKQRVSSTQMLIKDLASGGEYSWVDKVREQLGADESFIVDLGKARVELTKGKAATEVTAFKAIAGGATDAGSWCDDWVDDGSRDNLINHVNKTIMKVDIPKLKSGAGKLKEVARLHFWPNVVYVLAALEHGFQMSP